MTTQPQKSFQILLIGDCCNDVYHYGTVERISPEAPVPVFKYSREVIKPGMAYNVMNNLEVLGCNVTILTREPSVKIRLIDEKTKQHVVRIDHDNISTPIDIVTDIPLQYDAVVISDYDKGAVTYSLAKDIIKSFKGPVFIDSKKPDLRNFEGAFVKVNEDEFFKATSVCSDTIITLGSKGASYRGKEYPAHAVDVHDVCGAGDTFLAALTYYYLETSDINIAIERANYLAGISVGHHGVYVPTKEDINEIERYC